MPTPTIPAGNLFMNATTYTGTSATQVITNGAAGASFQPDLVWMKARNNANYHWLTNSVTGTGEYLSSNDTIAARTGVTDALTSFNSNGFSLGVNTSDAYVAAGVNYTGRTYVGWQWKAGGTAVTNTSGTISSQVSANTTSGFSVVTYTGSGSNGTVGHGLGVAPSMIIVKRRDAGSSGWSVYFTTLAAGYVLSLQSTGAQANSPTRFTTTLPTSTVFSIGTDSDLNASAGTYVAYCWSEIAGFSKFGSYTGNGSADGPFVYTGFRPKFVMIKSTTTSVPWVMYDTSRDPYNVMTSNLYPNLANAEGVGITIDFLSNGFKPRTSAGDVNPSGNAIYIAFAENPFKYANAR